ncbi:MAG: hypothetical protein CFE37_10270 [Alphaproteobacteria bacterium PA4]|nr:MAG: hypothetical protein CFE37_10270 [Alphaproteobacteria bacterium PA4]
MTSPQPSRVSIDRLTVIGLVLLLLPMLTMLHEIGGHAAACLAVGGDLRAIGAFYVDCSTTTPLARRIVVGAGVSADMVIAVLAWRAWRGARTPLAQLLLWLVWTAKGFVAIGYFAFSGLVGIGDLSPRALLLPESSMLGWRVSAALIGIIGYRWVMLRSAAAARHMLGGGSDGVVTQQWLAWGFYAAMGGSALVVGALNPLGLGVMLQSAAASTLGGLAGFIGIARMADKDGAGADFVVPRHWPLIGAGFAMFAAYAAVLGPTLRF